MPTKETKNSNLLQRLLTKKLFTAITANVNLIKSITTYLFNKKCIHLFINNKCISKKNYAQKISL